MKSIFSKLVLVLSLFFVTFSFFFANTLTAQAAGGNLIVSNTSYFIPASIEQRASTNLYICDSNNQPVNPGTLKGQTNSYSGLQAGTYKAIVVGSYSDMYGVGGGGSGFAITVPNPLPKQICQGLIAGYQTQTFQIQDGKTTTVNLGGKLEYNGNKSTFVRYWYTTDTASTGVSAVGIFSEVFPLSGNQVNIAIEPHSDICVDGVVTSQNSANPEVAVNPGNHTFNSVGYDSLGNSFCSNSVPDLNLNVVANRTYRIFQNAYQTQNLLTGYTLNISIVDGLVNGSNQSGGTVLTFTPTPKAQTVNNPTTPTNSSNTASNTDLKTINLANTVEQSAQQKSVAGVSESKPSQIEAKKEDIILVSNTELIRTGGFVQNLGLLTPMLLIFCTVMVIFSLRKS